MRKVGNILEVDITCLNVACLYESVSYFILTVTIYIRISVVVVN